MMPVPILLAFGCAVVLAFLLTPLSRRVAVAIGAVDQPEARKLHVTPVPRLGGIAVGIAVLGTLVTVGSMTGAWVIDHLGSGVAAAAGSIALIGAIDDTRGVSPRAKLALEFAAAAVVVLLLQQGLGAEPLIGPGMPAWLAPVLGALWIVMITNGINMLDVADGVAAGVGAIAALAIAVISAATGHHGTALGAAALSGGLIGFLPHNALLGRTFLGDSGSLLVGFLLGVASLSGLRSTGEWLVVPALLVLGLPLVELLLTVLRRLLRALTIERAAPRTGRFTLRTNAPGLFVPDRRHLPHRLLELGFGPAKMLATVYAASVVLGVLAWITARLPDSPPIAAVVVVAGVVYAAPRWFYEELRILDRGAFLPLLETRLLHNRFTHVVFDGSASALAFITAVGLTAPQQLVAVSPWPSLALLVGFTLAGCRLAGLYRASYRSAGLPETARAVRAAMVGSLVGPLALLVFRGTMVPLSAWILHTYLTVTVLVGARLSFRVLEFIHTRSVVAQGATRASADTGTD